MYRSRYPVFVRVATAIVGDTDLARDAAMTLSSAKSGFRRTNPKRLAAAYLN
jgi:hypothetical protein